MLRVDVVKPRWSSSSYLLYLGGLTVLIAAVYSLVYLSHSYGNAAYVGWAAFVLVVLKLIALSFRRSGRLIAAGLFGLATVIGYAAFLGALWSWFGWLPHSISFVGGFHFGLLVLELLTLLAALASLAYYRFPLISLVAALVGWYFVTDVLSSGGNWTAIVTLLVGLFYLALASGLDHSSQRPYGFWYHVTAGLLIGGSLIYFWHSGDTGWTLVFVVGLVYIAAARVTGRSSWAVLGSFAIFGAANHFGEKWARATISLFGGSATAQRGWVPAVVLAAVGFLFVVLASWVGGRRRGTGAPVPLPAE
jgi:hypothetical protein